MKSLHWISLGIAKQNIMKKNNFLIKEIDELNNGWYMISSDTYSYSNHELSRNFQRGTNFSFEKDDCVFIYYDPFKNTLSFKKKDRENYQIFNFCLEIEENDNSSFYPSICMLFSDNLDIVEILDENQLLNEIF